jgi:hypothetical protein
MIVTILRLISYLFPKAAEEFVRDYENEKVVAEYSHLISSEVL